MNKYNNPEGVVLQQPRQVEAELSKLSGAIEDLYHISEQIRVRLQSVTYESPVREGSDSKEMPEDYLVPIAARIRDFRKSIQAHTEQQVKLLSTIEL